MITAEELAKEIRLWDVGRFFGDTLLMNLSTALLPFIRSRAAGVQGVESDAALIKELAESAKALGHWSTLRSTDQATIDYWTDRVADLSRRLATPQPPKDAGAVPIPETPIYMLAVDGSHIHFTDGSGSTAEQMIAAVTMNRPGAKCDVRRLYTEQMMMGYGNAREAAARADAVPVCTCPSGDGSLRHPCPQHPPAEPAAPAADNDLVQVERGLLGAACAAIAKKRDAPKVLEALRKITMTPRAEPAARAQVGEPDDIAVDRFADAMKAKMAAARAKGRGGWEGPTCNAEILSRMLRDHVEKGDPLDVANFCMMLWNRGEVIEPSSTRENDNG